MKERIFIQRAKEHTDMEEFIRKQFSHARCGNIEVQHTPIMTRIIIHTITPGLVIGSGGERIKETLEELKKRFTLENPQIDVQRIENPDMEPYIIAQSIAGSIERGINYKRLGNYYTSKIMKAGAVGCEIVMSGKFTGQRSRKERFTAGYLKKCGEPAERDVIKGFAVASPKLGNTGVTVKIMVRKPSVILKKALPEEISEGDTKKEKKEETPRMGFHEDVVPQVLKGKTKTYRLRDHKLKVGDRMDFENSKTGEIFGSGTITNVETARLDKIDLRDSAHGETYGNVDELIAAFKRHHADMEVKPETEVIIYTFNFRPSVTEEKKKEAKKKKATRKKAEKKEVPKKEDKEEAVPKKEEKAEPMPEEKKAE